MFGSLIVNNQGRSHDGGEPGLSETPTGVYAKETPKHSLKYFWIKKRGHSFLYISKDGPPSVEAEVCSAKKDLSFSSLLSLEIFQRYPGNHKQSLPGKVQ
jgi:hypothetical protein